MPAKKAHRLKKSRKLGKVKPLSLTASITAPVLTSPTTAAPVTNATSLNIQTQPTTGSTGPTGNVQYDITSGKTT